MSREATGTSSVEDFVDELLRSNVIHVDLPAGQKGHRDGELKPILSMPLVLDTIVNKSHHAGCDDDAWVVVSKLIW